MDLISYPPWWYDPADCPWADEYYYYEDCLIEDDDDDDDDLFYVTNYDYPVHESSVQD